MKFKIDYKSRKTIIAIIALIVLFAVAFAGGYAFIRSKDQSTAATDETITDDSQNVSGDENNQVSLPELGSDEENDSSENEDTTDEDNSSNGNTSSSTGTTATEDATTVIEQVVVGEKLVAEDSKIKWHPEELVVPETKLSITKSNVTVLKKAETQTSKLTGNNLVQKGEVVTYTIEITNNGAEKLNRIEVSDIIPVGTTFKSVEDETAVLVKEIDETTGEEVITKIIWTTDIEAGQTVTVKFEVTVNEDAIGTITNVAIANGEESQEQHLAVIETEKTAVINNNPKLEEAKLGDEITYTISIENTGDVNGTVSVKDADLAKILEKAEFIGIVKVNGEETEYTAKDLIETGINVTVEEKNTTTIEFTVKVNEIEGEIYNVALIGDGETPTIPEIVDTIDYTVEKTVINEPANGSAYVLGEKVVFKVTITNIGSVALEDVKINDQLEGVKLVEGTATIDEIPANTSVNLIYEYEVQQKDLEDVEGTTILKNIVVIRSDNAPEKEAEVDVPTDVKKPDYTISKTATLNKKDGNTAEGKAELGDTIHYVVKVINTGNVDLENITVTDTMLDENGNLRTGTVDVTVAEREKIALEYDYVVTQDDINDKTTIYNKVTSGNKEDETNTPVVDKNPDYELEKTATLNKKDGNTVSGKAELGDTIHYVVKVINTGNVDLENITVTDTMKDSKGNNRTATVDVTVQEKEKIALEYNYVVTQDDINDKTTIYNKVTSGNKEDETNTPVVEKNPDYELEKTATLNKLSTNTTEGKAELGDTIHYVVKVINTGNVDLENITVTDTMLDENGNLRTGTVNVTVAEGEKVAIEYDYIVTQEDINNKETIYNKVTSGNKEDETNTPVVDKNADYELEKTATLDKLSTNTTEGKAELGDTIHYVVKVINTGNVDLENITVTDTMKDFEGNYRTGTVNVTVAEGEKVAIEYDYTVTQEDVNNKERIYNKVTSGDKADETETTVVEKNPDYELIKVARLIKNAGNLNKDKAELGDTIHYVVKVVNTGNVDLEKITVTDTMKDSKGNNRTATVDVTVQEKEKIALEYDYVVTQEDINDKTTIYNKVTSGDKEDETNTPVVEKNPDYELEKTATLNKLSTNTTEGKAELGDTIHYVVKVINTGNVDLENITVTDTMKDFEGNNRTATVDVTVQEKEKIALEYDYVVTQDDVNNKETIYNKVTSGNKEDETNTPVVEKNPDYELEKTATLNKLSTNTTEGKAELGDTIHYVVKVINTGNVDLENITVTDTMKDAEGNYRTGTVNVTVAEGEKVAIEYDYTVTQEDVNNKETIYNKVTSGDKSDETNTPVVEKNPDYELEKTATLNKKDGNTAEGKAELGDTIHYVVKVINTGNVDLENITVTDTMKDSEGNYRTGTVDVTVAEGEKVAIEYDYTVTQEDVNNKETIYNKVTSGDKEDETNTPVVDKNSDYELEKTATLNKKDGNTAEGKAELGDTIHYVVKVINTGNVDLENITVTDTMKDAEGNYRTGTVNVTVAEGEKVAIEYDYTVTQEDVNNKETIYNKVTSGDKSDETNTPVVEKNPDYELEKTATLNKKDGNTAEGKAELGDTIHYVVKVINTGNVDLENITVTDTMKDPEGNYRTGTVDVTVAEGEKVAIEYDYTVTQEDVNNKETIYNKVTSGDKSDETNTPVINKNPDYELIKVARLIKNAGNLNKDKAELGDTIHYLVKVINTGNIDLEDITVTDTMKDSKGNNRTATVDVTVAEKEKIALEYDYTVTQEDVNNKETIYNKVTSGDKSDETNTPVINKKPDYKIEKTARLNKKAGNTVSGKAELGDTIHYVVKVINTGNVDLEDITVTDTMKDSKGNNRTATVDVTVQEKEKIALEYDYVVTQEDINDKTTIYNKVTSGEKSDETNTPVVDKTSSYTVTKSAVVKRNGTTVTNKDENGNVIVKANDVIIYTITVTNTGNVTLKDLILTDEMLGIVGRELEDIEVGKHLEITETYTVTQADIIAQESITNIAYVNDKPSNPVEVVPDDIKPEISKSVDKLHAEYGDILTYKIKVKSIADIEQDIIIEDTIDTNKVEFISGSIKWDGEKVSDSAYNNGKITYETTISGINVEKVLEFKVRVISINVGEKITNTAYINKEATTAVTTIITKEVCVKYDAITENPIDVILVLDTSGSMANNSRMTNLKAAAKGIVNILFPAAQDTGSTISLIKFSNSATLIGTYTGSQRDTLLGTNTIRGEIDKLSSNGGTNEYAALDTTLALLQGNTLTNSNKIVIFLSDGAATTGTTYNSTYAGGLISENCASGYDNNTRTNIENKAAAIKSISGVTVYSVGLGIDSLATGDRAWVESCNPITVVGETTTSGNNATFTITVTNSSTTSITVPSVEASLRGVNRDSIIVTDGSKNDRTAVWSNVTVPANSSITLTVTATKSENSYGDPSISSVTHTYNSGITCTNSNHTGIPFTNTITHNSQLYHYMSTKAWGTYTLSKIATSVATFEKVDDSNDITTLTNTFANIIRKEVSGIKTAYADSMPVVIEIEETHTIIGDITVKIGDTSNTYTQEQLQSGINGLVYTPNTGFVWTINNSEILYKELILSYAY